MTHDPFAGRQLRTITGSALSGLGSGRPAHVSRRGNRFTLFDSAGNSKPVALIDPQGNVYIDVIIVDVNEHPSRVYYEQGFDENEASPPTCFSDNGTGPSINSLVPQSPTCAACPQAVWGSAVSKLTGASIPACQSSKKLAVTVVGDDDELVYEFVVPPGSWGDKQSGWRWYAGSIQSAMIGNRRAELYDVVTRINFAPGKMGILQFKPVRQITPEQAELVAEIWEKGNTDAIVGRLDKARNPAMPVAPKPQALVAPQPQPLPPPAPAQQATQEAPKKPGRPRTKTPAADPLGGSVVPAHGAPAPNFPSALGGGPTATAVNSPLDLPPFLQRTQTPVQEQPGQFGMQAPKPMDTDLAQALKAAFSLDT